MKICQLTENEIFSLHAGFVATVDEGNDQPAASYQNPWMSHAKSINDSEKDIGIQPDR